MKLSRHFLFVLLALVLSVGVVSAQRDPNGGRKDQPKVGNWAVLRMSDSCMRVFLSTMTTEDAQLFMQLREAMRADEAQLELLKKEMREARRAKDRVAATRIQNAMKDLMEKLRRERHALNELLIKYQESAIRTLRECGHKKRAPHDGDIIRDTVRKPHEPRDTVRKPHEPRDTVRKPKDPRDTTRGGGTPTDEQGDLRLMVKPVYPNPAGSNTGSAIIAATVCYSISLDAEVRIDLVDANGVIVKSVVEKQTAGAHCTRLDLTGVPPGRYLIVVSAGDQKQTQNFMIGR